MSAEKNDTNGSFCFSPRSEWVMISQGAEARVWKLAMQSDVEEKEDQDSTGVATSTESPPFVICKERFSKAYRHPDLDAKLTKTRCRFEARILEKCAQKSDIRVPKVIRISPPSLYLEYLDGPNVKTYLQEMNAHQKDKDGDVTMISEKQEAFPAPRIEYSKLAERIGAMVGRLHSIGVVHGDLTTSNMILLWKSQGEPTQDFDLTLIDFGLAKSTSSVEEQAVDLYVLERALESTHPELPDNFLDILLKAYSENTASVSSNKNSQTTLQRLEQVRLRGRKRECFG
mmetsp:Transcript_3485/g.6555  ORF Transcript_3485/g.6555 Transcript_3485/m.6555 type:complete len:286 (+) Transcript_3485:73-930(+)